MAWKYISSNSQIRYICLAGDTKLNGNVGDILYTYDDFKYYINVDGAINWQPYVAPKLTIA